MMPYFRGMTIQNITSLLLMWWTYVICALALWILEWFKTTGQTISKPRLIIIIRIPSIPGHGFQSKSYPVVILSDNEQFSIDRGFVSQVSPGCFHWETSMFPIAISNHNQDFHPTRISDVSKFRLFIHRFCHVFVVPGDCHRFTILLLVQNVVSAFLSDFLCYGEEYIVSVRAGSADRWCLGGSRVRGDDDLVIDVICFVIWVTDMNS